MNKIQSIESLKEIHDLLENFDQKHQTMIFFDLDLTIVKGNESDENLDVLIEPEISKKLFKYILENNISFCFITGRFQDTVCNKRKRKLKDIEDNIFTTLFPIFDELGVDTTSYKDKELKEILYEVKNDNGKTVGILYRGIFFTGNKGETIKYYRKNFELEKYYPHTIFIDDHEPYIKSVSKHIPNALIFRMEIIK